jgi:hypothetical protein
VPGQKDSENEPDRKEMHNPTEKGKITIWRNSGALRRTRMQKN